MKRMTYDFCINGIHCIQVKGADNLECKEVCEKRGDEGCKGCPIAKAFDRLGEIEDILGDDYDLEKLRDIVARSENQSIVCETLRNMVKVYQDEILPAFRELLYNREPIDRTPLLKCGDLVEINPERRKNKWKKGTVSQVLLCKGDEWVYNITVKHGYPETKHFSCKDEDIGDWVKPVR